MTPAQRTDLLAQLAFTQEGLNGGTVTAPFTVKIGHVDGSNICRHDSVVIIDAPQRITDAAVDWVRKTQKDHEPGGYVGWSMDAGGLLIR